MTPHLTKAQLGRQSSPKRYVRITHIFINLDDEIGERFCHRLQKHDFFALADLEAINDGCRHFLWREQEAIKTL